MPATVSALNIELYPLLHQTTLVLSPEKTWLSVYITRESVRAKRRPRMHMTSAKYRPRMGATSGSHAHSFKNVITEVPYITPDPPQKGKF